MNAVTPWLHAYSVSGKPRAAAYAYSTTCMYCHRALGPGGNDVHVECAAEWLCRAGRNKCVACGNADTTKCEYWCRKCAAAKPMRYVGYPGARLT